ncbi:hypothetical protein Anas_11814 [Armadillidium nasatum]|uniref:Uncharacterized protein n=1 Tax=Armadillidium nasatum TaxID=96803 RepID=A0A5N5TA95_9CRUS|nr:hypothetical protein Anas_11814 [Armadillidium nasatum]
MDEKLENKLEILFNKLYSMPDFPIEDDTVLQKLQSTLQGVINEESKSVKWCEKIGLITFITEILDENCISQEKNHSLAAFALNCFSSVVENEGRFLSLLEEKIMKNFRRCLPGTQVNMSLTSSALKVTESLITHKSGLNWVISNNVWENFLYFLKSQNIFIKKSCTKVLIAILLNVVDSQKFSKYIHDVEHMLHNIEEENKNYFRPSETNGFEDRYSLSSSIAKLQPDTEAILQFFHSLLLESLGKKSFYHPMKTFHDLLSQIIFQNNLNWTSEGLIIVSKLLLLGNIHKNLRFGDGGLIKEFCINSFVLDTIKIMENMISKGYQKEFFG